MMNRVPNLRWISLPGLTLLGLVSIARGEDAPPILAVHDAVIPSAMGSISLLNPETFALIGTVQVTEDPRPMLYDYATKSYLGLGAAPPSSWSGKFKKPWTLGAVTLPQLAFKDLGEIGLPPISPNNS